MGAFFRLTRCAWARSVSASANGRDQMTINDIREIYAAHGFAHTEESIQQADLPPEQEKELMNEVWRLHGEAGAAYGNELVREHQEWLRDIKAGVA